MTHFSRRLWSMLFFFVGLGSASADPRGAVPIVECMFFGCNPQITSMRIPSISSPGGTVFFRGKGFGLEQGHAFLRLQSFGGLAGDTDVALKIVSWNEKAIVATLPDDISGVAQQTGAYYVKAARGEMSNFFGAAFYPKLDLGKLPSDQVEALCADNATTNQCQFIGDEYVDSICGHTGTWVLRPWTDSPTIIGAHGTGRLHFSGYASADYYQSTAALLNGWVIDSFPGLNVAKTDGDEWVKDSGVRSGGVTLGLPLTVEWSTDVCGFIIYFGDVHIRGPIGVPCTSDPHSCGAN